MGRPETDREADIRKQHKEFSREGYDGHNRRSVLTTMQNLGTRRYRRLWNCRMRDAVIDLNGRGRFN